MKKIMNEPDDLKIKGATPPIDVAPNCFKMPRNYFMKPQLLLSLSPLVRSLAS